MILGSYPGNSCFSEIDEAVREIRGDDCVFFNAHTSVSNIPDDGIIYNMDLPDIHFSSALYRQWMGKYEVWEFSKRTADKFGSRHVPIGHHFSMKRFERNEKYDIDVAFFGAMNPRRNAIIEGIREKGWTVYCNPYANQTERDAVLSKCRIGLNMLYYENGVFPVLRAAHLAANEVPMISEKCIEIPEWYDLENTTEYSDLVDYIHSLLQNKSRYEFDSNAKLQLEIFKDYPLLLP